MFIGNLMAGVIGSLLTIGGTSLILISLATEESSRAVSAILLVIGILWLLIGVYLFATALF